jgi:hypothetical protein
VAAGNPNSEFIRIRCTKEMKESFEAYCAENGLSETAAARLGIHQMISEAHIKRTGKKLPDPEITPNAYGKRK